MKEHSCLGIYTGSSFVISYLIQLFITCPIWILARCPFYIGYLHK
jgi:hypothetical protein